MTSGEKEKSSNSKVKREITKQDHSKPGHLKKIKVGPGAKEEWKFSPDPSLDKCILILYKNSFCNISIIILLMIWVSD